MFFEKDCMISSLSSEKAKMVICPYCQGSGFVNSKFWDGHTSGWNHHNSVCGVCGGQKVLLKEISVKYHSIKNKNIDDNE